jgi:hypothetical protein
MRPQQGVQIILAGCPIASGASFFWGRGMFHASGVSGRAFALGFFHASVGCPSIQLCIVCRLICVHDLHLFISNEKIGGSKLEKIMRKPVHIEDTPKLSCQLHTKFCCIALHETRKLNLEDLAVKYVKKVK